MGEIRRAQSLGMRMQKKQKQKSRKKESFHFPIFLIIVMFYYMFCTIWNPESFLEVDSHSPSIEAPPLRVYIYDLDRRFNYDIIDGINLVSAGNYSCGESDTGVPVLRVGGVKAQHSVEYWMAASLMRGGQGAECDGEAEAVRVFDPDEADVFFVPFFSSLSFDLHKNASNSRRMPTDKQLQVDILKFLRESKYYRRSEGRDHVIPMHHPNALKYYKDKLNTSILVVADFARLPKHLDSVSMAVVAPYLHVLGSYTNDDPLDPYNCQPTLLFFRGRINRKDDGVIRNKLAKILMGKDGVRFE